MTETVEYHAISSEDTKLALRLAEHVTRELQAAGTDPFVIVAVAALLVGGYAACAGTTTASVTSVVGELAEHFDRELLS